MCKLDLLGSLKSEDVSLPPVARPGSAAAKTVEPITELEPITDFKQEFAAHLAETVGIQVRVRLG